MADPYRLIDTNTSGSQAIYTVDLSSFITFTGFEMRANGRQVMKLETKVNEPNAAVTQTLPQVSSLRGRFEVAQSPLPEDWNRLGSIVFLTMLPLYMGTNSESDKVHDMIDKTMNKKHDWRAMNARYKRDLPKLRQLLPMPQ